MIVKRQKVSQSDLLKAEKDGVIQRKPNGKWGIISKKAEEWWDADYKTKESAQAGLRAYQSQKAYSGGIGEIVKGWVSNIKKKITKPRTTDQQPNNPPNAPTPKTAGPLDRKELAVRQGYMESGFKSDAGNKYKGIFQIGQGTLDDYNKANKTNYTMQDMSDVKTNTNVRNWSMDKQERLARQDRPAVTDSVAYGQALAAHNYGRGNTRKALAQADKNGVDTSDSWEWMSYLPKETQDYINFGLRGQNNSTHRNNAAYNASKALNQSTVKTIKKSIE